MNEIAKEEYPFWSFQKCMMSDCGKIFREVFCAEDACRQDVCIKCGGLSLGFEYDAFEDIPIIEEEYEGGI